MSKISGLSPATLKRIKNYWLQRETPVLSHHCYAVAKYLLFDGTYFHKKGCLALVIDIERKLILSSEYIEKESYYATFPMFSDLKKRGLSPTAITLDGHRMVIRAILQTWPYVLIQRCLFHIQNQGLMWIRYRPKTEAGQKLRGLLRTVTAISSQDDSTCFRSNYQTWHQMHDESIRLLARDSVANTDLKRTMSLIDNALPNMFHFVKDPNIASTTNYLESLYSQLKHQYRNHRGLSETHKIQYLKWYCYFKNSNTF